jgi:hypothetical protein
VAHVSPPSARSPHIVVIGAGMGGLAIDAGRVVGVDLRPRAAAPDAPTERLRADPADAARLA